MSAVILPFQRRLAAFVAAPVSPDPGRPVSARVEFLRTSVRTYCHGRGHSAQTANAAIRIGLTQIANGQTRDYAVRYAQDHADRLHAAETGDAWGDDTR